MINSIIFSFILLAVSLYPFNMDNQSNGKLLSLSVSNVLRGVAILLVIIQHIGGELGTNIFTPLGGTGVAIFLFLSGYGLNESYKKKGLSSFWKNRIIKVFIPYMMLITVLTIIKGGGNLKVYLLDILGIKTYYWYIAFLLKQYILFYLCTRFFKKIRFYLFALSSLIMLFTFPCIEAEQSFSFLAGVLISEFYSIATRKTENRYLYISITFFLIGTIFLGIKQIPFIRLYEGHFIYSIVQLFIKLPYALFFILLIHHIKFTHNSKFLNFSGKISYELYLIHMIFLCYIKQNLYMAFIIVILSYIISYVYFIAYTHISSKLKNFSICR